MQVVENVVKMRQKLTFPALTVEILILNNRYKGYDTTICCYFTFNGPTCGGFYCRGILDSELENVYFIIYEGMLCDATLFYFNLSKETSVDL